MFVILCQVAAGQRLPLLQDQLQLKGHAFEARVYAEDPDNNFMPGAGPLRYLASLESRPDLRVETGVRQGQNIYYVADSISMVARRVSSII